MAEATNGGFRWTVGSLYGQPQHTDSLSASMPPLPAPSVEAPAGDAGGAQQADPGVEARWAIHGGHERPGGGAGFTSEGLENLDYSNPFGLVMEKVWFDGKIVFASEQGELEIDPAINKVAQEYQIVYEVELDERGKLVREPSRVPGQYNIYDSVPGMEKYSPLWQFNYVIVPQTYAANTLRSEADCLASGYPILRSNVFEN